MRKISRTEYYAQVAAATSERDLQDQVIAMARAAGWLVYHTHDSRRSAPGFPDLVLASRTHPPVLFRELKSQSGRLSRAQALWLEMLDAAGVDAAVWRPIDLLDGTIARALGGRS